MRLTRTGVLLVGSIWLLGVTLAWPARHLTAAVALLTLRVARYLPASMQEAAGGTPDSRARPYRTTPQASSRLQQPSPGQQGATWRGE